MNNLDTSIVSETNNDIDFMQYSNWVNYFLGML